MALVLSFFSKCLGRGISNMKMYDAACSRRAVAHVGWSCRQVDFCAAVVFKRFLG